MFGHFELMSAPGSQSVTSRLETSRYRDFSQFFESIGLGLKNFGLEKKSRYRSQKYLVSKKSLGIGLDEIFLSRRSVYCPLKRVAKSKYDQKIASVPVKVDFQCMSAQPLAVIHANF